MGNSLDWSSPPPWPPDLFAFVATVAKRSGCYSSTRYSGNSSDKNSIFGKSYRTRVARVAKEWRDSLDTPRRVTKLWNTILSQENTDLDSLNIMSQDAVMELISISDDACLGIGVDIGNEEETSKVCWAANYRYFNTVKNGALAKKKSVVNSICIGVTDLEACVLPKTMTPQVGCTMGSLTHHLSLLPSKAEVSTEWYLLGELFYQKSDDFNLIIVPFPYKIDSQDFRANHAIEDAERQSAHFSVNQSWLKSPQSPENLAREIIELIKMAESKSDQIHGVILPELSLNMTYAKKMSDILQNESSIELFIAGAKNGKRNVAYSAVFVNGEKFEFEQSKHHRWRLNKSQIIRYRLGSEFDGKDFWWEDIDISKRNVKFFTFRPGTVMASLVCEDLARIEPVQHVIRSVGPNLVVALLQDGPQISNRWSSKYATVLSEDPGSSVLTVTSLGMVEQSMAIGDLRSPRTIALWKDQKSDAKEIDLPKDAKAIVLRLKMRNISQTTLDGRTDGGATQCPVLVHAYAL